MQSWWGSWRLCLYVVFPQALRAWSLCPAWTGYAQTPRNANLYYQLLFIFKVFFFNCFLSVEYKYSHKWIKQFWNKLHCNHDRQTNASNKMTQREAEWLELTVDAAPVAVRNLLTSCPAVPLSRDKPLFTPLVPSPPAPTSLSDSGCQTRTEEETVKERLKLFLTITVEVHEHVSVIAGILTWVTNWYIYFLCVSPWTHQLVFDPLQLPLDDHLSQVHSQFPLLYGHTGGEAQTLHCTDHMLYQVVTHGVIHLTKSRLILLKTYCINNLNQAKQWVPSW